MFKLWPVVAIVIFLMGYSHWRGQSAKYSTGNHNIQVQHNDGEVLRLIAFGDYGTGNENQERVMNLVENICQQKKIHGILLLGDNIYMDGVKDIHDPKWQNIIEKPFSKPCISKLPLYPILGNHDYKGNPDAQIEYSKVKANWNFPNRFYSINFGKLLEVVALDTNYADVCLDDKECVLDFAYQRIENKNSRWQIAMGHHPVLGSSSKHSPGVQGALLKPMFCQFDAYLAGHSHHLEHVKPEGCQGEFFISGAAGADLYPPKETISESKFAKGVYGVLELTVDSSKIQYDFIDEHGNKIYNYTNLLIAKRQGQSTL